MVIDLSKLNLDQNLTVSNSSVLEYEAFMQEKKKRFIITMVNTVVILTGACEVRATSSKEKVWRFPQKS